MNAKKNGLMGYPLEPLTRREGEVLVLMGKGLTSREIAERLTFAPSTVRWYIQQVYSKLGVNNKRQALERGRSLGLLEPAVKPVASLSTSPKPKHNLPVQVTHFFGREAEIEKIKKRLEEWRLVTLTGSGGVGKTRLDLSVAEQLVEGYADGVWYVELAALADPELVPSQVAAVLDVRENPNRPILDGLVAYLKPRQVLLILDNCEHLLDSCSNLADALLHACPGLKILASSREPLGVDGEGIFRVPSLPYPEANKP